MKKNKKNTVFYKYKSLNNFEFILDLILKERLYAARYDELNDPMEGVIKVDDTIHKDKETIWQSILNNLRIVCFTKDPENLLMWSHYADGTKGCTIEFELLEDQKVHKIEYKEKPLIGIDKMNISGAREVLTYKQKPWKYEVEYRCILDESRFLPIKIKSVTFGARANKESVKLLMSILSICKPDLRLRHIQPSTSSLFKSFKVLVGPTRTYIQAKEGECQKCKNLLAAQDSFKSLS